MQHELITPVLSGTLNVLKACRDAGIKRVCCNFGSVWRGGGGGHEHDRYDPSFVNPDLTKEILSTFMLKTSFLFFDNSLNRSHVNIHSMTLAFLSKFTGAKKLCQAEFSSASAVNWNPNWPKDKLMDKLSWSDQDFCKKTQTAVNTISSFLLSIVKERPAQNICVAHASDLRDLVGRLKISYPNYSYQQNTGAKSYVHHHETSSQALPVGISLCVRFNVV
ncbi:hypothetical protein KSP40_PGU007253 [Platanthera guangdongensis]|uniref:Uncharacterized protein n=1 Tax=Platanthera guangdongensis TaxID=2320717 RepID=A0ABR2LT19_9ASPA